MIIVHKRIVLTCKRGRGRQDAHGFAKEICRLKRRKVCAVNELNAGI